MIYLPQPPFQALLSFDRVLLGAVNGTFFRFAPCIVVHAGGLRCSFILNGEFPHSPHSAPLFLIIVVQRIIPNWKRLSLLHSFINA